jgi:hypothetical protein
METYYVVSELEINFEYYLGVKFLIFRLIFPLALHFLVTNTLHKAVP